MGGTQSTYANRIGDTEESRVWRRRVFMLLGGLFVLRIIYLLLIPFDLVHDEAYYWDWSRQLDWCYYSKPPGVAWLIALATRLGASTAFCVRLPAAILSTASVYFVYALGTRLFGPKTGFFAALLTAATPGNAALGVIMTIDAPFLFCWSAALYFFWRMLERKEDRCMWTLLTMLAVGCGLLCKQTMLAFPCLAGAFVLLHREDRIELAKKSFWLCGLGALLFLVPAALWNHQHGWITLVHTQEHFSAVSVTLWQRLLRSLEFVATQLGLISPVTWLLFASVILAAPQSYRRLGKDKRFLIWFSCVPLAGVLGLSLNQRVEANWPAPFYVAGLILLAGSAMTNLGCYRLGERKLRLAVAVGIVSVLVTYCLPFAISNFGLKGSGVDALVRMWGWKELGQKMGHELADLPRPDQTFVLVASGRATASELAFYLPHQPHVYLWNHSDQVNSQYAIWGLPQDRWGWDALIVSMEDGLDPDLQEAFQDVEPLGQVIVPIGPDRRHTYRIWRGVHLDGWPAPNGMRIASRSGQRG